MGSRPCQSDYHLTRRQPKISKWLKSKGQTNGTQSMAQLDEGVAGAWCGGLPSVRPDDNKLDDPQPRGNT